MAETYNFPTRENQGTRNQTLLDIRDQLKVISGMQVPKVTELSHSQLHSLISSGRASDYLKVGDQIPSTWTDGETKHTIPWDVMSHLDGRDADHPLVTLADGSKVPGMVLQAHRAVPLQIAFDAKQAFYSQDAALPAGTYHFSANVSTSWGTSGEWATTGTRSFQFTTTKEVPARGQLVFSGDPYGSKLTTMGVQTYAQFGSAAIESVAITSGTGGTNLGTLSYTAVGNFNAIPRATYGSNDWSESALRQWLNSAAPAGSWQSQTTRWQRPHHLAATKAGFLAGFDSDFMAGVGQVLVKTESHPNSLQKGAVIDTYDRFFPPSLRQHYLSNYLSGTAKGYSSEGETWDYWLALAKASGRTSPWDGWSTYPELITYDADNTSQARYVWLRSARRWVSSSNNVGYVSSSGNVYSADAKNSGVCAAPACIMV